MKKIDKFNRLKIANKKEFNYEKKFSLSGFKRLYNIHSNLLEYYDKRIEETALAFGIDGVRGPEDLLDFEDRHGLIYGDDK